VLYKELHGSSPNAGRSSCSMGVSEAMKSCNGRDTPVTTTTEFLSSEKLVRSGLNIAMLARVSEVVSS
jgi:hypothetical protein